MTLIFGIDYAVINERIKDFAFLKSKLDFQFALYRLTQGYNIYDNVYTIRAAMEQAQGVGMLTGGWHQFDPTQSVTVQMDNFLRSWEAVKLIDLRPILAVESGANINWAAVPARVQADMLEQCCEYLKARIADPTMYTRKEYWDSHVEQRPRWKTLSLWAARYIPINAKQAPTMLSPWADGTLKFRDWPDASKWMWQYTDKGYFPGLVVSPNADSVNARIDLDVFNGTRAELETWKIGTTPAPIPVPAPVHTHTELESRLEAVEASIKALNQTNLNFIAADVEKERKLREWLDQYPG